MSTLAQHLERTARPNNREVMLAELRAIFRTLDRADQELLVQMVERLARRQVRP